MGNTRIRTIFHNNRDHNSNCYPEEASVTWIHVHMKIKHGCSQAFMGVYAHNGRCKSCFAITPAQSHSSSFMLISIYFTSWCLQQFVLILYLFDLNRPVNYWQKDGKNVQCVNTTGRGKLSLAYNE